MTDENTYTTPYHSEAINEIAMALSQMQSEVGFIGKNKTVAYSGTRYDYGDLTSILEAIREPLKNNDLSISQVFFHEQSHYQLVSLLMHKSGQWIKSCLPINMKQDDFKKVGTQMTYARRYALNALLGLYPGDEDDREDGPNSKGNVFNTQDAAPQGKENSKVQRGVFPTLSKDEGQEFKALLLKCKETCKKSILERMDKIGAKTPEDLPRARADEMIKDMQAHIAHWSKEAQYVG